MPVGRHTLREIPTRTIVVGSAVLNILMVASEAIPFAKTGGLADVCGALPIELSRLGHKVTLMIPAYRQARGCGQPLYPTDKEMEQGS